MGEILLAVFLLVGTNGVVSVVSEKRIVEAQVEYAGVLPERPACDDEHRSVMTYADGAVGWAVVEKERREEPQPPPDEPDRTRYSVRSIVRELRAAGKYEQFRAFLEAARLDWDFVGANWLSPTDADFAAMCAAVVTGGLMTREELDAMLAKCMWSEN